MAVTVHESSVPAEAHGAGVRRQRLLTPERVNDTKVLLDQLALGADSAITLSVAADPLAWFQILEGEARRSAETCRFYS